MSTSNLSKRQKNNASPPKTFSQAAAAGIQKKSDEATPAVDMNVDDNTPNYMAKMVDQIKLVALPIYDRLSDAPTGVQLTVALAAAALLFIPLLVILFMLPWLLAAFIAGYSGINGGFSVFVAHLNQVLFANLSSANLNRLDRFKNQITIWKDRAGRNAEGFGSRFFVSAASSIAYILSLAFKSVNAAIKALQKLASTIQAQEERVLVVTPSQSVGSESPAMH